MKNKSLLVMMLGASLFLSNCSKDDNEENKAVDNNLTSEVLADFSSKIAVANLSDLETKAASFHSGVAAFVNTPSQAALLDIQQKWYTMRISWEQSEAFLFGPVASLELDPAIDSWPVNFVDIDSVISGNSAFSEDFMETLNPTLKGFHPAEYLIFGQGGNRQYTELTAKQNAYLLALGLHLKKVTARMHSEWSVNGGNFSAQITKAGTPASQFATQQEAMLEIVNAMIGIVEEVGDGKIQEPFVNKDASLEESPFAKNSWTDFKNNITGVRNVYTGKYNVQGKGINLIVQQHNKALDLKIQQKIDGVIANLGAYKTPFGEAIISNPAAVQSTQTLLSDLKETMEAELLPLIRQHVK